MFCVDPSLTLLAKYGYNVVRLPRSGIEPLDVFGRDRNGIELLGQLPSIWVTSATAPVVKGGNVAAEIKTVSTSSLKASIGLRVLEDMLSGFGATIPKVDSAYTGKRSLTFSVSNIEIVKVEPFELGKYLVEGDLQGSNPWVGRYFLDDDAEAFIITEVLKSDAVTVSADSSSGTTMGLDIKALEKLVGADVKVEAGKTNQSEVTYKGPKRLTFGFKAFRITCESGVWKVGGVDPTKGDVYLDASSDAAAQPLMLAKREGRVGRVSMS